MQKLPKEKIKQILDFIDLRGYKPDKDGVIEILYSDVRDHVKTDLGLSNFVIPE